MSLAEKFHLSLYTNCIPKAPSMRRSGQQENGAKLHTRVIADRIIWPGKGYNIKTFNLALFSALVENIINITLLQ